MPAPLQRMRADDLLAAAFPDAAACLENIPGDRQIPDHPLVAQTVRDCLEEAMDLPRLVGILERIHGGAITCVARDTPEPSPLSHGLLNARPYAFMDDAPLEERRAHAVQTRRASEPSAAGALGALDADAIARVTDEAWPDPRDADELHDALVVAGFFTAAEAALDPSWPAWLEALAGAGRVTLVAGAALPDAIWAPAERLPEIFALSGALAMNPAIAPPAARAAQSWTRDAAIVELLRGRVAVLGPVDEAGLGAPLGLTAAESRAALLALESEGVVLRGAFTPGSRGEEWCDRRLLARIHRATLNRLRAEIEPIAPAQYMRFLCAWQHATPETQLAGPDGLRAVLAQLDGFELAADAWERHVLPLRVKDYDRSLLDMLCFSGEVAWSRLSAPARGPVFPGATPRPIRATPIALCLREHMAAWQAVAPRTGAEGDSARSAIAAATLDVLTTRGASFVHEIASVLGRTAEEIQSALAELVASGTVTSDGFGRAAGDDCPSVVAAAAPDGVPPTLAAARRRDGGRAMGAGPAGRRLRDGSRGGGRAVRRRAAAALRGRVPAAARARAVRRHVARSDQGLPAARSAR